MLAEYLIGRVGEAKAVEAKLPNIREDEVGRSLSCVCPLNLTLQPCG